MSQSITVSQSVSGPLTTDTDASINEVVSMNTAITNSDNKTLNDLQLDTASSTEPSNPIAETDSNFRSQQTNPQEMDHDGAVASKPVGGEFAHVLYKVLNDYHIVVDIAKKSKKWDDSVDDLRSHGPGCAIHWDLTGHIPNFTNLLKDQQNINIELLRSSLWFSPRLLPDQNILDTAYVHDEGELHRMVTDWGTWLISK